MSKQSLKPLADYIVAKADEPETKTKSGIILAAQAQDKPKTAVIVAVGKKVEELKRGERIIYKAYSTTEIKLDDEELILVKEEDVLSIVEGGK
jgi:chaperonin GroES